MNVKVGDKNLSGTGFIILGIGLILTVFLHWIFFLLSIGVMVYVEGWVKKNGTRKI